jgi:aryl-phospho-beta-D-glucosidase BglC (GH1 family)
MKSPNSDIIQNSKGSNDSTATEAYNKIVNSILTYAIIYKMQVNKYAEHYNITVDKSFFSNINNVILSVNTETNDLIDIDFSKNCVNANIDGVNNTSVLMKDVCNDCNTIKTDLNNTINDLKIKIWDVSLPPKLILALFLFLIVDTYLYILSTLR